MLNHARVYSLSTRARAEAYGGLLLLLLGLTILTFRQCPSSSQRNHRIAVLPIRTGKGELPTSVGFGNARADGQHTHGWWVGHFAPKHATRHSKDIETKWAIHQKGAKNEGWATNNVATTMAVLISGKQRIEFKGSHVTLENQGDYVIWGPGVPHSWTALEASTLMCIRWPSLAGDQDGNRSVSITNSTAHVGSTASHVKVSLPGEKLDLSSLTGGLSD